MKKWFAKGKLSSISKKIAYANSLAIGISISGTMLGSWIGDYYQNQAQENLAIASQQETLLHNIETSILKIRAHPQKLTVAIKEPFWFRYEVGQFEANVDRVKTLLTELDRVSDRAGKSAASIEQMSQDYQETIDVYVDYFEEIWPQVNPLRIPIEQRAEAQKRVLASVLENETRDIDIQFETLTGQLDHLQQIATDKQETAHQDLVNAKHLRERIIFTSLLFSIGIAILLSVYTGRKIASPLEVLTKTARKITQDANYDRQVPVKTRDEVGLLADSFNQLIAKVKQKIEQLAEAQYCLEERVERRTQELQVTLETLQETQTQLIQTEKMSSLGEMVAGVAHEINNPVSFIHGNVTHAQEYLDDLFDLLALYQDSYPDLKSEIQDKIEAIDFDFLQSDFPRILVSMRTGTQRIQEIVNSLRNFSRLDESEVKEIDLHEGIDSTLIILSSKIKQGIEIIKDYGDLPQIYCYPAQLNQVFLNLIVNGIDALLNSETEPKQITIRTCRRGDTEILISIEDNGSGIPETIRNKIFNPFFTTKPIGEGTGLGLAICYRIIEKHKGKIEVISEVGQGTKFTITLPTRLATPSNYLISQVEPAKVKSQLLENSEAR